MRNSNKLNLLPKELRVALSLVLGCIIIYLAYYGAKITKADVLFAEMTHTISDTLVIALLFFSFFIHNTLTKILGKISGCLLCLAGIVALYKAYITFISVASGNYHAVERSDVLFMVSLVTVFLIALQMFLVFNEHELLHGHESEASTLLSGGKINHIHTVHKAAKVELLADISQALAGLLEYVAIIILPGNPLLIRFVDLSLTIGIGWWMIQRGSNILLQGDKHQH